MTVSRPGGLPVVPGAAPGRPRRHVPGWAKVLAAACAVALVAVANVAASHRQARDAVAAADRVDVTTSVTTTVTQLELELLVTVHNAGAQLKVYGPRVSAPGFGLQSADTFPYVLPAGGTNVFVLQLRAPCRDGQLSRPAPDGSGLVLPVVPPSGSAHDITVRLPQRLSLLGNQACGALAAKPSVVPYITDVGLQQYAVAFHLELNNEAADPLVLRTLVGSALSISVMDGLPVVVPAFGQVVLSGLVSIPSCARLPDQLDPSRPKVAYDAFELQLSGKTGRTAALPMRLGPGMPMYDALRALARTICPPGSFRSGAGRRGGATR